MTFQLIDIPKWLFSITSIFTYLIIISFYFLYYKVFQFLEEEKEITGKDSDSRSACSACSEFSSKSEEKRMFLITKCFTRINEIMPEKIIEFQKKIIRKIYGDKKPKRNFIKELIDKEKSSKNNNHKGKVSFKENEEFMIFD